MLANTQIIKNQNLLTGDHLLNMINHQLSSYDN